MPDRPELPLSELQAAAGDDGEAHSALDDFHTEYSGAKPDAEALKRHAGRVRTMPSIGTRFESWWLDPHTQAFLAELGATGI